MSNRKLMYHSHTHTQKKILQMDFPFSGLSILIQLKFITLYRANPLYLYSFNLQMTFYKFITLH